MPNLSMKVFECKRLNIKQFTQSLRLAGAQLQS